jgi:hypothetical protein
MRGRFGIAFDIHKTEGQLRARRFIFVDTFEDFADIISIEPLMKG